MDQQGKKAGKEHSVHELTNEQIAEEMIAEISVKSFESMSEENARLTVDLKFIQTIIDSRELDNWMSVWSIINILTDKTEVDKLINEVPTTNPFHRNYSAVHLLVDGLNYWLGTGMISNQDSLLHAFNILGDRLAENLFMIG